MWVYGEEVALGQVFLRVHRLYIVSIILELLVITHVRSWPASESVSGHSSTETEFPPSQQ